MAAVVKPTFGLRSRSAMLETLMRHLKMVRLTASVPGGSRRST